MTGFDFCFMARAQKNWSKGTFAPVLLALWWVFSGGPRALPGCVSSTPFRSCCRKGPQTPRQMLFLPCCPPCPVRPFMRSVFCRKEETVTVYPADVVLFEGILAFYSQEVRDLFQMKLFVDTDADTRLSRRGAF